ncbi:MAG: AMP-binding protein [Pseudomonadales bacterium]|jgi:long-chain acyl-CoA synthetase|nr:AMP-binding protein [Pseudomonadales bacterium]
MARMTAKHAAGREHEPALVDETGTTSWGDFDARVNRLIHALRAEGLAPGDVFATFCGNRRECFELMTAAAHGGWLFVPVNWHFTAEELAYVVANADARLLVADARFEAVVREALERPDFPTLAAPILVGAAEAAAPFRDYEAFLGAGSDAEPADQCMGGPMFYTSGTTGRPKGVRSKSQPPGGPIEVLEFMSAGMPGMLQLPERGRTLLCGPVYHSAQWAFSFLPLMNGSAVVMRHRFDAADVLRTIDAERITNVHLVPTQFHRLLKLDEATRAAFDGGSLVAVWHGAAPCPPDAKRRMIDWWGPVVHEYYGSTEGSIVSVCTAQEWLGKPGSVGRPVPIVELRIVREDGTAAGLGESGQIYVKHLMGSDFEYHKEPEKTASAHLEPGVFTFGDVGYLDEDGYLFMSDRKIDMIISGGVNIYPAEIEGVLTSHPAVADAAVFGIPDEEFGEQVKAAVELVPGRAPSDSLAAELIAHVRAHLAGYKAPKSVDFEEALPRHPTGKLYKRLLRDRYWQESGRAI